MMKNYLIVFLTLITLLLFTACDQENLEGIADTSKIAIQKSEQVIQEFVQNQQEKYLSFAALNNRTTASTSRSSQLGDSTFSIEDAVTGLFILVEDDTIYHIPDCTVTVTDNGDFDTYNITAIDRFEEIENTVTYSLEMNFAKSDKMPDPIPFSIAWGQFSAWPVPTVYLFGYWMGEWVAEDEQRVVIEVPVEEPFTIYRQNISLSDDGFSDEKFEGIVRIVAAKL